MKTEKCLADLQLEVIYNDKCIKCGSCGAFCPNIFYTLEGNDVKVNFKEQCSETVGVCYNFCPRSELNVAALDQVHFGRARDDQALGVYISANKATLKSESLKDVTAALLVSGLESGMLDAVVTGDAKVEKALQPVVCKNKDEVLANSGERKGLGPLVWGAGKAIHEGFKKIAVVGRPCHAQALAKIRKNKDFLVAQEKIALVISHFCLAQGKGCTVCIDYAGEFADISLDPKSGEMLIRSESGKALVDKAVAAGYISLENLDVTAIRDASAKKKVKNFSKVLAKAGGKIVVDYLGIDGQTMKFVSKE